MRVDVELLLDRVALLREVGVLPGEVVDRIEGERLQPAVPITEPGQSVVDRRIDDTWPSDESARGDEMFVDPRERVIPPEALAIAVEGRCPKRRGRDAMREQLIVRAAAGRLEVE